jgi:hypothetical protein
MNRSMHLAFIAALSLVGCDKRVGDYVAVSSISDNGFARSGAWSQFTPGDELKVWGFVDHGNLYGDAGVRNILGDWWSGPGPEATTWRFNLKGGKDRETGHSLAVLVPNDAARDAVLAVFIRDVFARRPTKVFVNGRVTTFDAPMHLTQRTGLQMALQSSGDILFGPAAKN